MRKTLRASILGLIQGIIVMQFVLWPIQEAKATCGGTADERNAARQACEDKNEGVQAARDDGEDDYSYDKEQKWLSGDGGSGDNSRGGYDTKTAYRYNEETCRCETSQLNRDIREDYAACLELETDEERVDCIEANAMKYSAMPDDATEYFAKGFNEGGGREFGASLAGLNIAVTLLAFIGGTPDAKVKKDGEMQDTDTCYSKYLFTAASLVHFGGELYSYFFVESKLRDMRKRYQCWRQRQTGNRGTTTVDASSEEVDNGTANEDGTTTLDADECETNETDGTSLMTEADSTYQMQLKAFDFLAEEQDLIAEVANTKGMIYLISMAAYWATFALALLEVLVPQIPVCGWGLTMNNKPKTFQKYVEFENKLPEGEKYKALLIDIPEPVFEHELYMQEGDIDPDPNRSVFMLAERFAYEQGNDKFNFNEEVYVDFLASDYFGEMKPKEKSLFSIVAPAFFNIFVADAHALLQSEGGNTGTWDVLDPTNGSFADRNDKGENKSGVEGPGAFVALFTGLTVVTIGLISDTVSKILTSSVGIGLMALAAAIVNTVLWQAAVGQEALAKFNADLIRDIKKTFQASVANICPEGRDDPREPQCYCIDVDGGKNMAHANSETCQNYWKAMFDSLFVAGGNEGAANGNNIIGCLTINRQFDPKCRCRKFKNNKGGNACYSVPILENNIGGLGAGLGLGSTIGDVEAMTNGNLNNNNINENDALNRAVRARNAGGKMLKKINDKRISKGQKPVEVTPTRAMQMFKKSIPPQKILAATKKAGTLANVQKKLKPKDKALKKALKKAKKLTYSGGGADFGAKKKKKKDDFNFNFGGGKRGGGKKDINYMAKKYKYKGTDIVKDNGVSIWKVISNRYNLSLPKLID